MVSFFKKCYIILKIKKVEPDVSRTVGAALRRPPRPAQDIGSFWRVLPPDFRAIV